MAALPYLHWTRVANLALVAATLYAVAVVILRLPGVAAPSEAFRFALALHVELAVFIWLASSMAAQWALNLTGLTARAAPHLAAIATLLVVLTPLGGGTPVMADYFPWIDGSLIFSLGFALFCAAALIAAASALWHAPTHARSMPAWCFAAAALTIVGDVMNGARDPYLLAWGAGHVLLFSHVAMLLWEWSTVAGSGKRIARIGGGGLVLIALALAMVPWIFAPGTPEHRLLFTESMRWLLWPPAALLLVHIVWQGTRQHRRMPVGLAMSISLLPLGLLLGTLIQEQTTLITAHYHAAIGAVAISRMAMTYRLHAKLGHRVAEQQQRRQLRAYSLGIVLLVTGLLIASTENAPRKTAASERTEHGPAYRLGMGLSGAGGMLAMAGTLWFVVNLTRRRTAGLSQTSHGRAENRPQKCQAMANTASTAVANSQGIVQS